MPPLTGSNKWLIFTKRETRGHYGMEKERIEAIEVELDLAIENFELGEKAMKIKSPGH